MGVTERQRAERHLAKMLAFGEMYGGSPRTLRAAFNAPVQSTASDIYARTAESLFGITVPLSDGRRVVVRVPLGEVVVQEVTAQVHDSETAIEYPIEGEYRDAILAAATCGSDGARATLEDLARRAAREASRG